MSGTGTPGQLSGERLNIASRLFQRESWRDGGSRHTLLDLEPTSGINGNLPPSSPIVSCDRGLGLPLAAT